MPTTMKEKLIELFEKGYDSKRARAEVKCVRKHAEDVYKEWLESKSGPRAAPRPAPQGLGTAVPAPSKKVEEVHSKNSSSTSERTTEPGKLPVSELLKMEKPLEPPKPTPETQKTGQPPPAQNPVPPAQASGEDFRKLREEYAAIPVEKMREICTSAALGMELWFLKSQLPPEILADQELVGNLKEAWRWIMLRYIQTAPQGDLALWLAFLTVRAPIYGPMIWKAVDGALKGAKQPEKTPATAPAPPTG